MGTDWGLIGGAFLFSKNSCHLLLVFYTLSKKNSQRSQIWTFQNNKCLCCWKQLPLWCLWAFFNFPHLDSQGTNGIGNLEIITTVIHLNQGCCGNLIFRKKLHQIQRKLFRLPFTFQICQVEILLPNRTFPVPSNQHTDAQIYTHT